MKCLQIAAVALLLTSALPAAAQQRVPFERFDKNGNGRIERAEIPETLGPVFLQILASDKNGDRVVTRAEYNAGFAHTRPKSTVRPFDFPTSTSGTAIRLASTLPGMSLIGFAYSKDQIEAMFRRLDKNGDGKLTRDETPAELHGWFDRVGKKELTPADLRRRPTQRTFFQILDGDSDGVVTRAEIQNAPASLARSPENTALLKALRESKQPTFNERELTELLLPIVRQQAIDQVFSKMDVNGDGRISVEEAPPGLAERLSMMLKAARVPRGVELTKDEFTKIATQPSRPQTRIPAAFRVLDADRDGRITPDELTDVVRQLGRLDADNSDALDLQEFLGPGFDVSGMDYDDESRPTEPARKPTADPTDRKPTPTPKKPSNFVDDFFSEFDKDKNNKLTTDEVPSNVSSRFSELDLDNDGALSRAELTEALAKARNKNKPKQP